MLVGDVVWFAVNPTVNRVNETIPLTRGRVDEKRPAQDALPAGCESNANRVIHSAGHNRFHSAPIWPRSENVRGFAYEWHAARALIGLLRESAFAPINP